MDNWSCRWWKKHFYSQQAEISLTTHYDIPVLKVVANPTVGAKQHELTCCAPVEVSPLRTLTACANIPNKHRSCLSVTVTNCVCDAYADVRPLEIIGVCDGNRS